MKHIIIGIFLTAILFACGKQDNTSSANTVETVNENAVKLTDAQIQSAGIQVGKLEKKDISTILKVNGTVDVPPQSLVSVSMPLGGYLKSTHLLPGMYVKKGEVIATMEDQQYIQLQEDYLVTKSNLEYAASEYNRQKELYETKSSSEKVFQQARMEYDNQKIALRALAEKMELIHLNPEKLTENNISNTVQIYAPISGFVSAVKMNIGRYVTGTDVLFELINPLDIHLNLRVFEKDIEKLSIGQSVMAYTLHQPDKKYPCEIMLISQALSDDRTAEVHCHFEKYDKILLPGMYLNAEIAVKNHNAFVVPEDAVVIFEGKSFLFVAVSKNEYKMTLVETGVMEAGAIEIKNAEALSDADIVTAGAYTILMEMKNKSEE
ncbi:MAG: efflux RND transporter periplasmic adaptor subunit [Saprospiraceae bacterium]|nr:efflux RND transporter periplasmic adaptor subunit [Candidatus Opimibacter skivensis]